MEKINKILRQFYIDNSKYILIIVISILCIISFSYISIDDLLTFDCGKWTDYLRTHDFLSIYHISAGNGLRPADTFITDSTINYPPIYPLYLYIISFFYSEPYSLKTMALVKMFTIIPFIACTIFLYKKISRRAALAFGLNITMITNAFLWGQKDAMIVFLGAMIYYFMKKRQAFGVTIVFAISLLLKPQCCYFAPIYILYLITTIPKIKMIILHCAMVAATFLIAFLPFMIYERSIFVPLRVYAGNVDLLSAKVNSVAPNAWYILFNHSTSINHAGYLGGAIIVFCMILFIVIYYQTHNLMFSSIVYMYLAYMIGIGQNVRYGIYIIMMLFIALYVYTPINDKLRKQYLKLYIVINTCIGLNQLHYYSINQYFMSYLYHHDLPFVAEYIEELYAMVPYCEELAECYYWISFATSFIMMAAGIYLLGKVYNHVLTLKKDTSYQI